METGEEVALEGEDGEEGGEGDRDLVGEEMILDLY